MLNAVRALGKRVDQVEALAVLGQDWTERAWDNVKYPDSASDFLLGLYGRRFATSWRAIESLPRSSQASENNSVACWKQPMSRGTLSNQWYEHPTVTIQGTIWGGH